MFRVRKKSSLRDKKNEKWLKELAHLEKQLYQIPPKSWNKQTDAVNIIAAKIHQKSLALCLEKFCLLCAKDMRTARLQ